jgi:hypothetical protein
MIQARLEVMCATDSVTASGRVAITGAVRAREQGAKLGNVQPERPRVPRPAGAPRRS